MKNKEAQGTLIQCPMCAKEVYRDMNQLIALFDDKTIFSSMRKLFNTNYFGIGTLEDTPKSKKHKDLLKIAMLKSVSYNDKESALKLCSFFYPCGCFNDTLISSVSPGFVYDEDDSDLTGWFLPAICSQ